MPRFQRSRGGCATCKRRKRKCDETRPTCLACRAKGIECDGYGIRLRWDSGAATPGHHAGRQSSENDDASAIADETAYGDTVVELTDNLGSPVPIGPTPTHSPEPGASISAEDQLAFAGFVESGIHGLFSTTIHEWIKPLIAENAQHSEALVIVCASLQLLFEEGHSLRFHQSFERALQIFQIELSACNGVIRGCTLGAGLLLCTLSLLQGLRWTSHILCMADLYSLHGDLQHLETHLDPYALHCLEVMGVMDQPSFVLGRTTTCLGFWRRLRKAQRLWNHVNEGGIEPVSGLPRTLLDIFAQIGEPGVEEQFWLWHGEIGEFMQSHLWDAWRFAGMLDHRRRWRSRETFEPFTGITLPTTEQLMFRLLSSLEALRLGLEQPENHHLLLANGTYYPYVMASLEFKILTDRPAWKSALDLFREKFLSFDLSSNVQVLVHEIADAQQREDLSFDADASMRAKGMEIALF